MVSRLLWNPFWIVLAGCDLCGPLASSQSAPKLAAHRLLHAGLLARRTPEGRGRRAAPAGEAARAVAGFAAWARGRRRFARPTAQLEGAPDRARQARRFACVRHLLYAGLSVVRPCCMRRAS